MHQSPKSKNYSIRRAPMALSMVDNCYFNKVSTALIDLLDLYSSYNFDLLDRLQFVIVDDGSPIKFESAHLKSTKVPLNLTFIRIKEDIVWNQVGARNLGLFMRVLKRFC
jgi:hypothetical protein